MHCKPKYDGYEEHCRDLSKKECLLKLEPFFGKNYIKDETLSCYGYFHDFCSNKTADVPLKRGYNSIHGGKGPHIVLWIMGLFPNIDS